MSMSPSPISLCGLTIGDVELDLEFGFVESEVPAKTVAPITEQDQAV